MQFRHLALQMSEEQLKAFLEGIKTDTGLQEKLKAAADADAVVAIANAEGFAISAEELNYQQEEVSKEELEGATGGASARTCGAYTCRGYDRC